MTMMRDAAPDAEAKAAEPATQTERKAPTGKDKHQSPAFRAALAIGAAAFLGMCLLIAFGIPGSETSEPTPAPAVADEQVAESAPAVEPIAVAEDVPAAQDEPVVESAVEPATAEPAVEPATEEPAVAEPAVEEPAVGEPAVEVEAIIEDEAVAQNEAVVEEAVADVFIEAVIGPDSPALRPDTDELHAILADNKLYLRGTVPSREIEEQVVAATSLVLGPGNVISEYTIDSTAPYTPDMDSPVYIDDRILFASGSAAIAEDFYPLLRLIPILLTVQPDVTVTISGYTDSDGSDQANLALSQARVDAARQWAIDQGADGNRLVAIGLGESDPIGDNATPEGRQLNRRVEFLISGFDLGN